MLDLEKLDAEVGGWFNRAECQYLYQTVLDLPADSKIIEVGCYRGRSTICMLQACKDSEYGKMVWSVDSFYSKGDEIGEASPEDIKIGIDWLYRNINIFSLGDWFGGVYPITSKSWFGDNSHNTFDMFFIDGCHLTVAYDLQEAWKLLKPKGILVAHDYDISTPGKTVADIDSAGLPGSHCGIYMTSLYIAVKS